MEREGKGKGGVQFTKGREGIFATSRGNSVTRYRTEAEKRKKKKTRKATWG